MIALALVMHELRQPFQHMRDPCPADAEIAGKSRPILELAGIEQRLVIAGELERIAWFFRGGINLRFGVAGTVPGEKGDDSRSM